MWHQHRPRARAGAIHTMACGEGGGAEREFITGPQRRFGTGVRIARSRRPAPGRGGHAPVRSIGSLVGDREGRGAGRRRAERDEH